MRGKFFSAPCRKFIRGRRAIWPETRQNSGIPGQDRPPCSYGGRAALRAAGRSPIDSTVPARRLEWKSVWEMPDFPHSAVFEQHLHNIESNFDLGIFQQAQVLQGAF